MTGIEDILYKFRSQYEKSPLFLQMIVGNIYRSIPLKYRLGKNYFHFKSLLNQPDAWSESFIKDYQNAEFIKTIEVAKKTKFYPRFYKEHGIDINSINSIEQINQLPFLEKHHLQEFREEMINPDKKDKSIYITTGGSTGTPTGFYYESGITRPKEQAFIEKLWQQKGYEIGDKCAVIRGRVVSNSSNFENIAKYDAVRNWLILSSYHLNEHSVADYIDRINKFKPKFIQGFPSSLTMLAKLMNANGIKLKTKIQAVFTGSENISDLQIKEIEEAFGADLITWYGHSEVVILGGFCNYRKEYHIYPQYGYTEIIEDGTHEKGIGELVGTGFHNEVMPLIRFKTGDYAKISETTECKCGQNFLFLEKVLGRITEFVYTPSNRKISLASLNMHDEFYDNVRQWQIEQRSKEEIIFRYEPVHENESANHEKIIEALEFKLSDVKVVVERVEKIETTKRGKIKILIQHIKEE